MKKSFCFFNKSQKTKGFDNKPSKFCHSQSENAWNKNKGRRRMHRTKINAVGEVAMKTGVVGEGVERKNVIGECSERKLAYQENANGSAFVSIVSKVFSSRQGGHVSELFYFRISRFQCRIIMRNYDVSKFMRKLVITMSQQSQLCKSS